MDIQTNDPQFIEAHERCKISTIARVCHEANRGICEAFSDFSQKDWLDAEPEQRDSAERGVRFTIANPNLTPADQHDAWCRDKVKAGWTHGPVKDFSLRTHPCLVPYAELPENQKVKDHVFRAIVKAMTL